MVRKTLPKTLRNKVWDTYIGKEKGIGACFVCGRELDSKYFECGHVTSVKDGGDNTLQNLRPICSLCNKSMGTMDLYEFKKIMFPGTFETDGVEGPFDVPEKIEDDFVIIPNQDPVETETLKDQDLIDSVNDFLIEVYKKKWKLPSTEFVSNKELSFSYTSWAQSRKRVRMGKRAFSKYIRDMTGLPRRRMVDGHRLTGYEYADIQLSIEEKLMMKRSRCPWLWN